MEQNIEEYIKEQYGSNIANEALNPSNMRFMVNPHANNGHITANGEEVEFYMKFDNDRISECTFIAKGGTITFASASVATKMVIGMKLSHAITSVTPEAISEELGEIGESDGLYVLLVHEALNKTLLDGISIQRDPWKKLYAKPGDWKKSL